MEPASILAGVAALVTALGSWRKAKQAADQTNGQLHGKLDRMEMKIDDLAAWQSDHIGRWHQN